MIPLLARLRFGWPRRGGSTPWIPIPLFLVWLLLLPLLLPVCVVALPILFVVCRANRIDLIRLLRGIWSVLASLARTQVEIQGPQASFGIELF